MAKNAATSQQSRGLTTHFKGLKIGETVALVYHPTFPVFLPKRIEGQTGVIIGKRGKSYIVKVKQGSQYRQFIVESAHLKKIKSSS
ncbi:MAG: hypothetical protein V1886_02725 [archaeon]